MIKNRKELNNKKTKRINKKESKGKTWLMRKRKKKKERPKESIKQLNMPNQMIKEKENNPLAGIETLSPSSRLQFSIYWIFTVISIEFLLFFTFQMNIVQGHRKLRFLLHFSTRKKGNFLEFPLKWISDVFDWFKIVLAISERWGRCRLREVERRVCHVRQCHVRIHHRVTHWALWMREEEERGQNQQ